jgi:uncharacterized surface protein with fasciclin (FAS1) repeats
LSIKSFFLLVSINVVRRFRTRNQGERKMTSFSKALWVGSVVTVLAAASMGTRVTADTAAKDIVDTAVEAGSFKTLTAALQAAGLVETLKGNGPFTVFAPTDAAFAKLPKGTVEDLLKPENKAKLTAILTYHVVPGQVTAAQAARLPSAKTVNGASLTIHAMNGTVMVDNATVTSADIACTNGVIHVIDTVILPKPEKE